MPVMRPGFIRAEKRMKKHRTGKYRISGISHPFTEMPDLANRLSAKLGIDRGHIQSLKILKKSIDARKGRISFVYTLEAMLEAVDPGMLSRLPRKDVAPLDEKPAPLLSSPGIRAGRRPVIIGFGPAGIFAAFTLLKKGFRPIIFERGDTVAKRKRDVRKLWKKGVLNPESNVVYGEGGAGTFSDGKLATRIKDHRKEEVLEIFKRFVRDDEIFIPVIPHLGTDRLEDLMEEMRKEILRCGGEIHFRAKLEKLWIEKGILKGIVVNGQKMGTDALFLATGHSARDTVEMVYKAGVAVAAKSFAMGFRVEHPQSLIDRACYGAHAGHPLLPAASYFLSFRDRVSGRGVYTFCMCPGGAIICSSSEEEGLVTNGMSFSARNSGYANAGVVVTVTPDDYDASSPLAGMAFQRHIEKRAFKKGGERYFAPVQSIPAFLEADSPGKVPQCTYRPGWKEAPLAGILPDVMTGAIQRAIVSFNKRMTGFSGDDGVITAVESRTSSPCRLLRDPETFQSVSIRGVFPIGEGAGYAGGIVSSAVDGIKAAEVLRPGW